MTTDFMAHRLHRLEVISVERNTPWLQLDLEIYCAECDLFIDRESIHQAAPRYRLVVTPITKEDSQ